MSKVNCPLCSSGASVFHSHSKLVYYRCDTCMGIFVDQAMLPTHDSEKSRYLMHQDPANDTGYADFVAPMIRAVTENHSVTDQGLDFGSGAVSFICKILQQQGFVPQQYDPFFRNDPGLLQQQFDYIVCCEVIEHFHYPHREFQLLRKLLKPCGKLYCMTHLYEDAIDFPSWYYIRDFTHVFFYSHQTLKWIKQHFDFKEVVTDGRLITFSV